VTALHRATSDVHHLDGLDLEFRSADILDKSSFARAVEGHDVVIHAAAKTGGDGEFSNRVNSEGTRCVVRTCREHGVKRFVHVSSVAAIGIPPRGTIADEQFPFNLENSNLHYHISKKRAEEAVLDEVASGLDAVIVNPAFVFGPYGNSFRGGYLIDKVRQGHIVPYFMGGLCVVHVNDVVEGIIAALLHGNTGERYILGGENLTYKELVQQSAAAFGLRRHFLPLWPSVTGAAAVIMEAWGKLRHQRPRISFALHRWATWMIFYSSAKGQRRLGYQSRPFSAILQECVKYAAPHR
jgi:dihydroflavonol-4-reductase